VINTSAAAATTSTKPKATTKLPKHLVDVCLVVV
jgi:hypothetical protein